jgi:hypothetical protein
VLAQHNTPDVLLKSFIDFIDIGDPSVINLVYSSISSMYEKMAKNEYSVNFLADAVKMKTDLQSDTIALKFHTSFTDAILKNHE